MQCAAVVFAVAALGGEFSPAYFWMWNDRLEPANLLVNALNEREHVRIARDYPPDSCYNSKQIEYDKSFQASGLFGPVRIRLNLDSAVGRGCL